ncbi:MAG TPA: hypothetical protein VFE61_00640 [Candidatus Sulfotelmatobacter sp.]|nr:hypothetical protein [Candidatus Sulfotelmatobacter sp.]
MIKTVFGFGLVGNTGGLAGGVIGEFNGFASSDQSQKFLSRRNRYVKSYQLFFWMRKRVTLSGSPPYPKL